MKKYRGETIKGWAVMRRGKVKRTPYGKWILILSERPSGLDSDEPDKNIFPVTIIIKPRKVKP